MQWAAAQPDRVQVGGWQGEGHVGPGRPGLILRAVEIRREF